MRLTILLLTIICIWTKGFTQSQTEMNLQSIQSAKKVDNELNTIYQKVLTEYKSDTVFIKNLKVAQQAWITFRDAELHMKFPERGPNWYGSIQPVCVSAYIEHLTRERIRTLKIWIEGIEEGDACNQ